MNEKTKNILTVVLIILVTALVVFVVMNIPGYAKPPSERSLPVTLKWVVVFLVVDLILIGIPAGIHRLYVGDYSLIRSVWFFAIFGGVAGAMLGEQGRIVMIIPYTILMLIYAFFYKKFTWWKVALTAYLAGVIIENVINRSPIQSPTSIWIAFFIYPYFVTKIWEHRKELSLWKILKDFKWAFVFVVVLLALGYFITHGNMSPPLILLGITLPFVVSLIWKLLKRRGENRVFQRSFSKE